MDDTGAWGLIFAAGHWNCGGWTIDSRDRLLICACGAEITDETGEAAA